VGLRDDKDGKDKNLRKTLRNEIIQSIRADFDAE
jgi:hypothetical protein